MAEDGHVDPFRVDGPIDLLLSNETPTGAFSPGPDAYAFVWVGPDVPRPGVEAGSHLVRKAQPQTAGPYEWVGLFSRLDFGGAGFWQVAPVVVRNEEHPGLPTSTGEGLVVLGQGFNHTQGTDAVHVGWIPLDDNGPDLTQARYITGPGPAWGSTQGEATALFERPGYTSLSATYLVSADQWLVLYSRADKVQRPHEHLVVRLGPSPWELSNELDLLDPDSSGAFTTWLHHPGLDTINPDVPPAQPPGVDDSGWLCGAHLLSRFTRWDVQSRQLTIHYLVSSGSPYQVHLMRSVLEI